MTIGEQLNQSADAMDALLTYANGVTEQADSTIGDAIKTLCDGFGHGGGGIRVVRGELLFDADVSDYKIEIPVDNLIFVILRANADDLEALPSKAGYGIVNTAPIAPEFIRAVSAGVNVGGNGYAYYDGNGNVARAFNTSLPSGARIICTYADGSGVRLAMRSDVGGNWLKAGIRYIYELYFKED